MAPSTLLAIDQNRTAVVERIVADWGDALATSNAGLSPQQLRTMLTGMRADHLFAATLAGSLEGLRDVIASAVTSNSDVKGNLIDTKAVGDTSDDLVYTPVVPCRILDTRTFGGAFAAGGETRSYHAYLTSGTFATQGGAAGNCAIPANPSAVALNITTVGGGGYLTAWPYGIAQPPASTLNPEPGVIVANGALVPICHPSCAADFNIFTFSAQVIIDVVGYFRPPQGAVLSGNLTVAGNVGIGTSAPTSKLEISGAQDALAMTGFEPFLTLRDTGGGNKKSVLQGANGDVILLTNGGEALVLKDVTGNVGLGTSVPAHHLDVNGGPSWTSNFWAGAIALSNASAIGWHPDSGGKSFGIGQSNGGLYVFNSASAPGDAANPANYLLYIPDNGNVLQNINNYGIAKAMVELDYTIANNTGVFFINKCYNGFSNSSTGNCGFVLTQPGNGIARIDFGSPIANRFISVSARYTATGNSTNNSGANYRQYGATSIEVFTFPSGDSADTQTRAATIILY